MDSLTLRKLEREYTLSQINWKRSLTDVDMKRRKNEQRERSRMDINIIKQITSPTLSFELENFKFYGKLNKTETEIHNTLPSLETVMAEKDFIRFEKMRKLQPQHVKYVDFYSNIQNEAKKPRTPNSPAGIARSGIETPMSRALSRRESRTGSFLLPTPRPSRSGSVINTVPTPRGSRTSSFINTVPPASQNVLSGVKERLAELQQEPEKRCSSTF